MRRKCLRALIYLILFVVVVKLTLVSLFVEKSSTTQCHDEAKAAYRLFVQHSQLTVTEFPNTTSPIPSTWPNIPRMITLRKIDSGSPSICPSKETTSNSSEILKLGSYPQEKRFLSIGISSITRPTGQSYLDASVKRLIDSLSKEDMKEIFLVIFLADLNDSLKSAKVKELSELFKGYIDQGLLQVITAPREYYPPLSNLKKKFGDSQERVIWRSKLVVDFSFVMCYCKDLSLYYLHLEDDLIPAPSFYPKLRYFITSQETPWPILDAAYMGHTAKVYHSSDLDNIATFFYLMYNEMPGDWLIEFWRKIKYDRKNYREFVLPAASLFQHIGDHSSFRENKNSFKSKEKFFDAYDIKYKGLNPPAVVTSSMQSSDGTKPEDAYNKGSGFFWANQAKQNDFIDVRFNSAATVREVSVETGSYQAPKDYLESGILEASFLNNGNGVEANSLQNCNNYEKIGDFKDGQVKVSLDGSRNVSCLKILVTRHQVGWLFVREINVW